MSPKHCQKCGDRGGCLETRQYDDHVYRRYQCGKCQHRWPTYEVTLEEDEEEELEADNV